MLIKSYEFYWTSSIVFVCIFLIDKDRYKVHVSELILVCQIHESIIKRFKRLLNILLVPDYVVEFCTKFLYAYSNVLVRFLFPIPSFIHWITLKLNPVMRANKFYVILLKLILWLVKLLSKRIVSACLNIFCSLCHYSSFDWLQPKRKEEKEFL